MMIEHIKARINERSTWLLISGAVTAASALASPWSYATLVIGVVSALIPDGNLAQ